MNRYGARSDVPIARSRAKIESLLQAWGCKRTAFLDDYEKQQVEIQFFWTSDDAQVYAARFSISTKPEPSLTQKAQEAEVRGRFRTLLYWLRAALDAVDAGVIEAEALFLPWLVGADGITVSEALLPRLRELGTGSIHKMLRTGA